MIKLNKEQIYFSTYPNHETVLLKGVLPKVQTKFNTIYMRFESDIDLMRLMMVKRWIDDLEPDSQVTLQMPYVPYSRMDRAEDGSAFSLKYVCDFINSLGFKKIHIFEAHSFMTEALLNNVSNFDMSKLLARNYLEELEFGEDDYVFLPDAGAVKRYSKDFKEYNIITANKIRDFQSGDIKGLEIVGATDLQGGRVMIVDDLCSAGGSFYFSALKLKEINAGDIYLTVAHCEDTIHNGKLLKGDEIKRIYTTNSILTRPHAKITTYNVEHGE